MDLLNFAPRAACKEAQTNLSEPLQLKLFDMIDQQIATHLAMDNWQFFHLTCTEVNGQAAVHIVHTQKHPDRRNEETFIGAVLPKQEIEAWIIDYSSWALLTLASEFERDTTS